jgi:tRNA(Ile)-lysidine synthase
VLARIRATIARYGMFAPGQRVGVAVSGGADSVCLLHLLHELAPEWALALSVLHLNHGLRGDESRADEEFVRTLAAGLGLPFHSRSLDVAALAAGTGDNLEQAARRLRREFFSDFLARGELDRVALGHTRSDQAETVLFRLLRGAGTAGLAAIRPVTPEGFVRPLLDIDRAGVLAWLGQRSLPWREDSSNRDPAFARNRIRHDLLPRLTRDWNPDLPATLAGMARVALDEEAWWEGEIGRVVEGRLERRPPALLFRADWLRALPPAVARRVIRRAIQDARGDLRGIDLSHVEQFLALTASCEGSGRLQIPGLDVFRSFDWIRLAPPGLDRLENRDYELPLPVPGRLRIPQSNTLLCLDLQTLDATGYNEKVESELDWELIAGELYLRNWRPGDQYRPVGHARETKIKLLFQQARIPLWERRRWPIISCQSQIVWVARFGPAAQFAATPGTRALMRVRAIADPTEF